MTTSGSTGRPGRETRLLALIVVVSIAVLLLLAQLRYPSAALRTTAPTPGPLVDLVNRATFDDLSQAMNALLNRVSSRVVMVELGPSGPSDAGSGRSAGTTRGTPARGTPLPGASPDVRKAAIGLRVREDLALVHTPLPWRPVRLIDQDAPAEIVAEDTDRQFSLVRTPSGDAARLDGAGGSFGGLAYVALLDAAPAGPTIRPVFTGRVAEQPDRTWAGPLFELGRIPGWSAGGLVFQIDGRLIGLALENGEQDRIVPASVLEAAVAAALERGAGAR